MLPAESDALIPIHVKKENTTMKLSGLLLSVLLVAGTAYASDEITVAKGKELFAASSLGTNGKSCNTCHSGGKGMDKVATQDADDVSDTVNQCITKAMKGKALDPASADMKSMVLYIKSFAPAAHK